MNRVGFSLLLLCAAGCPGPELGNPPKLWVAPNGSELMVKLVPVEPPPY